MMNMVVEGLRGEAALVAMDLGMETLLAEDGIATLTEAMGKHVFPKAEAEAKDLYRAGHKTKGILSRQPGEAMVSYVSRRKRWWKTLKTLDSTIDLSPTILGDLMLEAAGLNRTEQLLVLTSTGNNKQFEILGKALLDQHPRIHHEDTKSKEHIPKRPYKGKGKGFTRTANIADAGREYEDWDEE